MLNLEQQHIYEQMEVYVKLACELCRDTKEMPVPPLHLVKQTEDYLFPFEEYRHIAMLLSKEGWRIMAQPDKLSDYHRSMQKRWLEELGVSEEDLPAPESGEPIVVCGLCSRMLDEQSKAGGSESSNCNRA